MNPKLVPLVISITLIRPALAKPKERPYPANCDRVWTAVKVATAPPHYNFAQLDDSQKKGIVSTGNFATGKRLLDITLTGTGDACTVAIGGSFSGLAHNDKGDLFERIKDALVEIPETIPKAVAGMKQPTEPVRETSVGTPVTNADVLKLKDAGLGDQLIIDKINASPSAYNLDASDLVNLKRAGLSDAVIGAMIQASHR